MNKINKKACFPYTYGDDVKNDDKRLSNYIVDKLSDRRTQQFIGSIMTTAIALGRQAAPSNAIPPEYGDATVNALKDIPQQLVPGANAAPQGIVQNPVDVNQLHQKAAEALGNPGPQVGVPNPPKKPYVPFFPGPPVTTKWQATNSLALIFSVGVICANGAWGNPWAATVCAGALFKAAESLMASLMK